MLGGGQGKAFGSNAQSLCHEKQYPTPPAPQIEQCFPPAAFIDTHPFGIKFQLVRFSFLKRLGLRVPFSARIHMMIPIEPIVEECVRVVIVIEPVAERIMVVDGRILPRLRKVTACSGPDYCNHIEYRKMPENAQGGCIDTDAQELFIVFIVDLDEPFRIPFAQPHTSFQEYSLKETVC